MTVSESVAELFPGVGSTIPPAAATVAVFDNVPVADIEILAVTVYVTLPPAGRLTVSLILPEPEAVQVPPPAPTHVQFADEMLAGKVSATVDPGAFDGPALLAVIV